MKIHGANRSCRSRRVAHRETKVVVVGKRANQEICQVAKESPEDIKQAFKELTPRGIQTLQCALYEAPWSARAAAAREILDSHLGPGAAEPLVEHFKQ
jgi:hypothetical protein